MDLLGVLASPAHLPGNPWLDTFLQVVGMARFRGRRRVGEALGGRAGKGEPLRESWCRKGGEVPGGVGKVVLQIWNSLSILSQPIFPCSFPASPTLLVASGGGEGPGKFVATSLSREPLGRWALKLEPRV